MPDKYLDTLSKSSSLSNYSCEFVYNTVQERKKVGASNSAHFVNDQNFLPLLKKDQVPREINRTNESNSRLLGRMAVFAHSKACSLLLAQSPGVEVVQAQCCSDNAGQSLALLFHISVHRC